MAVPYAEKMAESQKEISISDFFAKNRQILGFDNPSKALLVSVKEAVDNSLDACEEAGILPIIFVRLDKMENKDRFVMTVRDNGPGIVKKQIPNVFGRLLYGSRFHAIRQSRGQQGIGISSVVLYSQLTSGKAAVITSKIGDDHPCHRMGVYINTKTNRPQVENSEVVLWEPSHGTEISVHLEGRYQKNKKQSVYEYLRATAIVNPHVEITFQDPDGDVHIFHRVVEFLPESARECKPHPLGIELGVLKNMLKYTEARKLTSFLTNEFVRMSPRGARELLKKAGIDEKRIPKRLPLEDIQNLFDCIQDMRFMSPPTDCLSPIGDMLIRKGLRKEIDSKFAYTVTRDPYVFRGTPFQVEAGIVYGGDLPPGEQVKILRFGNRVPLLYQQGGCALTHAIERINWRPYGMEQRGGKGIPAGPAVILVHVASTNIPFTSESKEAVADVDEILDEIGRALMDCGRRVRSHINKKKKLKKVSEKYDIIREILPEISRKSSSIVGRPEPLLDPIITKIMNVHVFETGIVYHEIGEGGSVEKVTEVTIKYQNYTQKDRKLKVHVKVPNALIQGIYPDEHSMNKGIIEWEIGPVKPARSQRMGFSILGLDKDDYDEVEVYYSRLPGEIIGADPL
ncbi:MAG: DNA topoisomerase VI subunit B [Candidatus Thermoplasmatota archaeon]|nr:DNA topoisomerase VI subunit B [Candidatus Thermoplasmatota archaeon]